MIPRTASLSQDVAYKVLCNPRRRAIIYLLRTASEPVDVMSLAESIASWEQETPRDELTRGQRKRVYVSLYQTHIPKLESVDIVVQEENAVRPTSKIYELDSYLTTENSTSPWYYVTGIASAIALVFLALIALEPAVGSTSAYLVTTVLLAAMAIVATGQFVGRRRENRALPPELLLGPGSAGETP